MSYFKSRSSDFEVVKVLFDRVFIIDLNRGNVSVTNDAESVRLRVSKAHGNRRIVYRDSDGNWDELLHDNGNFVGFAPYREATP